VLQDQGELNGLERDRDRGRGQGEGDSPVQRSATG
jgi:hypothetical protein